VAALAGNESDFLTLHELITAAKIRLNPNIWDYLIGGTETETTVRRNRMALDSVAFRPRVLVNVAEVDPSGQFFAQKVRLPVALAPVGSLESFDAGGGASAAEAAGAFGVPIFVSSVTQPGLEAVAAATAGPKVFQLYVRGDDGFVDDHAERAIAAGYDAFCITVDSAVYSRRERDIAKRFRKYWRPVVPSAEVFQAALSWRDIERFKRRHAVPLILKGIATAEDAAQACALGVEGIYVSNHGGRQLDHGRGALDVLPEVVDAVAGRARIIVDGGFCRGSDVVKAIALGADTVGIGRLYCYGLAAAGAAGVARVLALLEIEVKQVLGLLGVTSLAQVGRAHLHPATPVVVPHVHSAFPLLNLSDPGYR
jgi:isopentenyl diphosphate isomerase/L-lactate dehydrogenase-like FMN-dependent dehydrogenase